MTEDQRVPAATTDEQIQDAVDKFAAAIARDVKLNGDAVNLIATLTQIRICAIFQRVITDELDKRGIIPEAWVRRRLVEEVLKETNDLMSTIALAPADAVNGKGKRRS